LSRRQITDKEPDSATATTEELSRETEMLRDKTAPEEITAAAQRAAPEETTAAVSRAVSAEITEIIEAANRVVSAEITETIEVVNRAVSAEKTAAAQRAVPEEIIAAVIRADLADAEQSPDRDPAAQELLQPAVRVQDPVWRKADAAEQPAEPVRARLSAEKLRSTEMIIRER